MRRLRVAMALAAVAFAASGLHASGAPQVRQLPPLPSGAIGPTVTAVRLAGGGIGIVRPLTGAPVAAVQLWFRAPSIGFGAQPKPGLAYVAAYAVAASRPLTGTSLATLVARCGGRFGISVYPGAISISAMVPASQAPSILRAMSAVYFTPVLSQEGLTEAIGAVRQEARIRAIASPEETLRNGLFAALFSGGPNHFAATGDDADPRKLTLDEIRTFSMRAFRATNATAILTGGVDAHVAASAVEGRAGTSGSETPAPTVSQLAPVPQTLDVKGPVSGFGYAWAGPPIANEREATALDFVADYLFNGDTGRVVRALGSADVAINAQYVTYFNPGVMYVEATGSALGGARAAIDGALVTMRSPLDLKTFEAARSTFEYHVASDVATPLTLADNFGWYAIEGATSYAPGADLEGGKYVRAIHELTPQFVAATVAKYLGTPRAVVTLSVVPEETPPPLPTDRPRR